MSQARIYPRDPSKDGPLKGQGDHRLESWKEISSYLGRSERTVRRWEETEELPVHRHHHEKRGSVYAYASELDAWRQSRSHLGPRGINNAGESLSSVAAEAEPEEENDESPSSSSGAKSWGNSLRLLLTAALLWMLPRRGYRVPADPPANVGVRTKSRVWARFAVVAGFLLLTGATLLHYGGWQARRTPSPESGSLVRAGTGRRQPISRIWITIACGGSADKRSGRRDTAQLFTRRKPRWLMRLARETRATITFG
jgi:hypothetical protein